MMLKQVSIWYIATMVKLWVNLQLFFLVKYTSVFTSHSVFWSSLKVKYYLCKYVVSKYVGNHYTFYTTSISQISTDNVSWNVISYTNYVFKHQQILPQWVEMNFSQVLFLIHKYSALRQYAGAKMVCASFVTDNQVKWCTMWSKLLWSWM